MATPTRRLPLPLPKDPPPGPFRRSFWKSPLRGSWLTSILGSAMLPLFVIAAITGFLSHAAYDPDLTGNASTGPGGGFNLYFFTWPSSPAWLYALTQGLHVIAGVAVIPLLLAKLWSVIPQLWEWPPIRSVAHSFERLSLGLLVGSSLFVLATGLLNIQYWYVFGFNFVPGHYYGAMILVAALTFHVAIKMRVVRRSFREQGVTAHLREDLAHTRPEPEPIEDEHPKTPTDPDAATISRRGMLGAVGATSLGLALMVVGQVVRGPFEFLGLLAPRAQDLGDGPQDFQVNKTFAGANIEEGATGASWRLKLAGTGGTVELSRDDLLRMPQATEELPIACVEGWSTTQTWTGVRLRDLARAAGMPAGSELFVESLQQGGAFRTVTLTPNKVSNPRSLLALKVNGADLAPNHGFPARVIVPALPGVHNTKWVASLTYRRSTV